MSSTRTVTLIANGVRRVLACSAEPSQLGTGAQLWGGTSYAINSRRVALIPGERVDTVQAQPRTFVVPVFVEGATELEVDQNLADLLADLNPAEDCRILYRRADGAERELVARYPGGGDAVAAAAEAGYLQRHVRVPLVFRAHFPYWRDLTTGLVVSGPTTFQDGRGAGSNEVTFTNPGDVECWPELIITGHAEAIEVTNLTTGGVLRVVEVIPVGSTLRIDADPGSFGVWIDDVEADGAMDTATDWWPLAPGVNELLVRGNTATGAEAIGQFTIRCRPLFESP
jgi:hypothetical protein